MSTTNVTPPARWQQCTPTFIKTLPVLDFPFDTRPQIFSPANTALRFMDGAQLYAFQWCYLRRKGQGRAASFDPSSLSEARVKALPVALERLSKWLRFKNVRPRSANRALQNLGLLLSWADHPQHVGRFEELLNDPDLALEALKGHHTYLRNQLQNHQLAAGTVGLRDQDAIACLSEIHGRVYTDYIEPLQVSKGKGTEAPEAQAVGEFGSTLQAIFDSAAKQALGEYPGTFARRLQTHAGDDSRVVTLPENYGPLRLMELACVAYTGLVFADSGANLAVLKEYEEPDDLERQLAEPDRINLTQKAIKFRAGGKDVEVHLSATTLTRLRKYLRVRQKLVVSLNCADISPMFIQCTYESSTGEPTAIRTLDRAFLEHLRRKVTGVGVQLPKVTLRQLRAYKQQDLVRRVPLSASAKLMGTSVRTAIVAYCKALEETRRGELGEFLGSLEKTVLKASETSPERAREQAIPVGVCTDHGNPSPTSEAPVVAPDCRKVEGCFFCDNYRLHADAEDMRKLMSCRRVLAYISPLGGDSIRAERIFTAVTDRIGALLGELKRLQPLAYESARMDVEVQGNLTRYWAGKVQQLHLLGMLPTPAAQ